MELSKKHFILAVHRGHFFYTLGANLYFYLPRNTLNRPFYDKDDPPMLGLEINLIFITLSATIIF